MGYDLCYMECPGGTTGVHIELCDSKMRFVGGILIEADSYDLNLRSIDVTRLKTDKP